MGEYTYPRYHEGVRTGFLDERITAWHMAGIPADELRRLGYAFDGPVPTDVAAKLLLWEPTVIEPGAITALDGDGNVVVYSLPDRLSRFVGNPNTQRVINVTSDGYNANLHLQFEQALQAATDANLDIASVVCLGDGAHMGMSFRARDGITLGGDFGGAVPYVGFNSSLTGKIATQLDTGTILRVCDNTMAMAAHRAVNALKIKRTRNSNEKLTASNVRAALDIAFDETENLCDEFERLANVPVSEVQLFHVVDRWCPIPDEMGRGRTMRENQQAEFLGIYFDDDRQVFGESVAGLWQTHNTWQHWSQGSDGANRLDRQAKRTMSGFVGNADDAFMEIVAREFALDTLATTMAGAGV